MWLFESQIIYSRNFVQDFYQNDESELKCKLKFLCSGGKTFKHQVSYFIFKAWVLWLVTLEYIIIANLTISITLWCTIMLWSTANKTFWNRNWFLDIHSFEKKRYNFPLLLYLSGFNCRLYFLCSKNSSILVLIISKSGISGKHWSLSVSDLLVVNNFYFLNFCL